MKVFLLYHVKGESETLLSVHETEEKVVAAMGCYTLPEGEYLIWERREVE